MPAPTTDPVIIPATQSSSYTVQRLGMVGISVDPTTAAINVQLLNFKCDKDNPDLICPDPAKRIGDRFDFKDVMTLFAADPEVGPILGTIYAGLRDLNDKILIPRRRAAEAKAAEEKAKADAEKAKADAEKAAAAAAAAAKAKEIADKQAADRAAFQAKVKELADAKAAADKAAADAKAAEDAKKANP